MKKVSGYTLVEVATALIILALTSPFFFQGFNELQRHVQDQPATIDWYLMLRELENPDHRLGVAMKYDNQERGVKLVRRPMTPAEPPSKIYFLSYFPKAQWLVLKTPNNGMIHLMRHVTSFKFTRDHQMTITITGGQRLRARLLLPDVKGEVSHEEAPGDSTRLSH
ncbi:hypothetical protein [Lactiplantibacillus plajomi]|uniref:Prepilin-type N-terminal cleavage/methylation domain-containing protein n=1 Tax=Lactiplantibacillus plajomi TaxID=1457217 RepID=A0ABV6K6B8_9LACO|nr:hypothetical protein [Lactiplantibacillus plajomi]